MEAKRRYGLDLIDVREACPGVLGGQRRRDDDPLADLPVRRGRERARVGDLEAVEGAEDLVEVASDRLRIGQRESDLVAAVDEEDGADRGGVASPGWIIP